MTASLMLGLLLLQAAWLLTMPPFAGMDEFDHAYRASAAAHGEWYTNLGAAEDGRGMLVTVNDGIAEAARARCEALDYPGPDNCRPVASADDGMVIIASAAAIYQPTFYVAVGWVTWFVDGNSALYMMRVVSGLLCAALFGGAVWVVTGWARSAWPVIAIAAVVTPTTAYSLVIVAPNGIEIMLAVVLWACLIGTTRSIDRAHRRRLLMTAAPVAVLFAWVRPFSPVWLLVILCVWAVLLGVDGIRRLISEHGRLVLVSAVGVGTSALTSALWVLGHPSGQGPLPSIEIPDSRWGTTFAQIPLWLLQVISAVPFRNSSATLDVYAAGVVLFALLLLPLALPGRARLRVGALLTAFATILIGLLYTYSRLPTGGALWQGRYAWCAALGTVLLAAVAFEERGRQAVKVLGVAFGVPAMAVMHVRALQFVLEVERDHTPPTGDPAWVTAPTGVVIGFTVLGLCAWVIGGWNASRGSGRGVAW